MLLFWYSFFGVSCSRVVKFVSSSEGCCQGLGFYKHEIVYLNDSLVYLKNDKFDHYTNYLIKTNQRSDTIWWTSIFNQGGLYSLLRLDSVPLGDSVFVAFGSVLGSKKYLGESTITVNGFSRYLHDGEVFRFKRESLKDSLHILIRSGESNDYLRFTGVFHKDVDLIWIGYTSYLSTYGDEYTKKLFKDNLISILYGDSLVILDSLYQKISTLHKCMERKEEHLFKNTIFPISRNVEKYFRVNSNLADLKVQAIDFYQREGTVWYNFLNKPVE